MYVSVRRPTSLDDLTVYFFPGVHVVRHLPAVIVLVRGSDPSPIETHLHSQPAAPRRLVSLLAVSAGVTVANLYYSQPLSAAMGRSLVGRFADGGDARIVTVLASAAVLVSFGVFAFLVCNRIGLRINRGCIRSLRTCAIASTRSIGRPTLPAVRWLRSRGRSGAGGRCRSPAQRSRR